MSTFIVRTATHDDLAPASRVLAEAFIDDPVIRAVLPGDEDRLTRIGGLFHATLASGAYPSGRVDVAIDASTGDILGVAAWEAPDSRRGALARQLRQFPRFVAALGWCGLPRGLRLLGRLDRHRPASPHWYLAEIGVSAAARGRGVGGELLRTQLAVLDATRQSAYLESSTPDNRRLYRRLGFRELGAIRGIPGARPMAMLRTA